MGSGVCRKQLASQSHINMGQQLQIFNNAVTDTSDAQNAPGPFYDGVVLALAAIGAGSAESTTFKLGLTTFKK